MKIIIHRGTHQIGGSCVEIATDKSRVIIDVGLPLEAFNGLTEAWRHYPAVPGLFGPGPKVDAVLLSHAHGDHSGLMVGTRDEIPIYLSRGTSKMLMAGALFARQPDVPQNRQRLCRHRAAFTVGEFKITPLNVDHSAFDALAFLIEHAGKCLLYSGDLRLHGRKPGMAAELVAAATEKPLDAVILEGTHLGVRRATEATISEAAMEERAHDLVRGARGPVLAMFSPLNIDRLVTYLRLARQSGRTLVLDPYAAFVLYLARGQAALPDPFRSEGIRIFVPPRFWSTTAGRRLRAKFHGRIEARHVTSADIASTPDRWIVVFRPWLLDGLFGGKAPAGTVCLYSYWRGYLEKPELRELQRCLEATGAKFEPLHASGHIYRPDIVRLLRQLKPRMVVPIHTTAPEEFSTIAPHCRILQDGEMLEL